MNRIHTFLPRSTVLGSGPASIYTVAAGVFVAVCQALNQLFVHGDARTALTVVIGAAGAYGIQPLFGPALTTLLQIPSNVLFIIAAVISAGNGALAMVHMSSSLHAIAAGLLTLVGAIIFGSPVLVPPGLTKPRTAPPAV